ncbi:hypothetical protein PR048_003375 [Dryococelus australis]|uniref:Uncharacterized protein n=1 Tax=Dryococelus australis TaxID=614101 RepID=A0ABQ9IPC7_9NEOP|nr:hypothetical protein PR048_003375 [Dryococelus australis]
MDLAVVETLSPTIGYSRSVDQRAQPEFSSTRRTSSLKWSSIPADLRPFCAGVPLSRPRPQFASRGEGRGSQSSGAAHCTPRRGGRGPSSQFASRGLTERAGGGGGSLTKVQARDCRCTLPRDGQGRWPQHDTILSLQPARSTTRIILGPKGMSQQSMVLFLKYVAGDRVRISLTRKLLTSPRSCVRARVYDDDVIQMDDSRRKHKVNQNTEAKPRVVPQTPTANPQQNGVACQQHVGTTFANQRLVTYLRASSHAHRVHFAAHVGIRKFHEFNDLLAILHSSVYTRASDVCSLAATPESSQCYFTPGRKGTRYFFPCKPAIGSVSEVAVGVTNRDTSITSRSNHCAAVHGLNKPSRASIAHHRQGRTEAQSVRAESHAGGREFDSTPRGKALDHCGLDGPPSRQFLKIGNFDDYPTLGERRRASRATSGDGISEDGLNKLLIREVTQMEEAVAQKSANLPKVGKGERGFADSTGIREEVKPETPTTPAYAEDKRVLRAARRQGRLVRNAACESRLRLGGRERAPAAGADFYSQLAPRREIWGRRRQLSASFTSQLHRQKTSSGRRIVQAMHGKLGSPLVDDRPIMNAVKYWVVSGLVWTNWTMVSPNIDANRTGIHAVVAIGDSLLICLKCHYTRQQNGANSQQKLVERCLLISAWPGNIIASRLPSQEEKLSQHALANQARAPFPQSRFSRGFPVYPALAFRHCFIPQSPSSALLTLDPQLHSPIKYKEVGNEVVERGRIRRFSSHSALTVTSNFSEALLKFYFQRIFRRLMTVKHSHFCFLRITGSWINGACLKNCRPITTVGGKNKCLDGVYLASELIRELLVALVITAQLYVTKLIGSSWTGKFDNVTGDLHMVEESTVCMEVDHKQGFQISAQFPRLLGAGFLCEQPPLVHGEVCRLPRERDEEWYRRKRGIISIKQHSRRITYIGGERVEQECNTGLPHSIVILDRYLTILRPLFTAPRLTFKSVLYSPLVVRSAARLTYEDARRRRPKQCPGYWLGLSDERPNGVAVSFGAGVSILRLVAQGSKAHLVSDWLLCGERMFYWLAYWLAVQRHDGNTARFARRSDEALGVRVRVARIAPSLLDLGTQGQENFGTSKTRRMGCAAYFRASVIRSLVAVPVSSHLASGQVAWDSEIVFMQVCYYLSILVLFDKKGQENFASWMTCRLDSSVLCILELQLCVHWLLPHTRHGPGKVRVGSEHAAGVVIDAPLRSWTGMARCSDGKRRGLPDDLGKHAPSGRPACVCRQLDPDRVSHTFTAACVLVSPVSLPRFLTLDAGFPWGSIPLLKTSIIGAVVPERLDCSPPTKTNRVQYPACSLRIFVSGNRSGRCLWSVGFLGDLPFPPPPFHSGAAPYSPRFTPIGSKHLDVKIRPNLCTHSLAHTTAALKVLSNSVRMYCVMGDLGRILDEIRPCRKVWENARRRVVGSRGRNCRRCTLFGASNPAAIRDSESALVQFSASVRAIQLSTDTTARLADTARATILLGAHNKRKGEVQLKSSLPIRTAGAVVCPERRGFSAQQASPKAN